MRKYQKEYFRKQMEHLRKSPEGLEIIKKRNQRNAEFFVNLKSNPEKLIKYRAKVSERHKAYYQKNREKILAYNKVRRAWLTPKNKELRLAWEKRMMMSNAVFNVTKKTRKRIRNLLTKGYVTGITKERSLDLLGCSYDFFKAYIESKFTKGMTWEKIFNGQIHIEHIRPLASFFVLCPLIRSKAFHYSNTQPLWKLDNLSKGSKLNWKRSEKISHV